MAALLGMGLNIRLSKMAEATPVLTYKQLANVSQWRMHEDANRKSNIWLLWIIFFKKMEWTIQKNC